MNNNEVLDYGYVILLDDYGDYCASNVGLFRTKRNAEKQLEMVSRVRYPNAKVVKVNVVIADE